MGYCLGPVCHFCPVSEQQFNGRKNMKKLHHKITHFYWTQVNLGSNLRVWVYVPKIHSAPLDATSEIILYYNTNWHQCSQTGSSGQFSWCGLVNVWVIGVQLSLLILLLTSLLPLLSLLFKCLEISLLPLPPSLLSLVCFTLLVILPWSPLDLPIPQVTVTLNTEVIFRIWHWQD